MFRIFHRKPTSQPEPQPTAEPAAQRPPLQANQLTHLEHATRPPAGNTILTSGAPTDAADTATLALFIRQHQAPDLQLLSKADRLARLHTRPLGWSNTLPVVIRPESPELDALSYLRAAHQGPSVSPAPIPGTPPWHPQAE